MPEDGGPWERAHAEDPRPKPPRGRVLVWLALLAALVAGIWLLAKAFPGEVSSDEDWAWVIQGVGLVALVSSGILATGRVRWAEKARHAAIWVGIVGALVLGVTFRDEFASVGQRVRSEFSSSYPVDAGARELVVTQAEDGGFFVMGKVNGQLVRFLVDTGASDTVLSPADARRLGVDTAALSFDHASETANGVGYAATFTAQSLAVGSIRFTDVPLMINQAPMTSSLLGMTFLRRLESFQVRGRKLYLKARD
jgi:aspartyl protease family protein